MAAQIVFTGNKEYKVVNWIDGMVYITTFSAAGKESTVRSEKTKARVMAALVEKAHGEAIEADEAVEWSKITPLQREIHETRVAYGLLMKNKHRIDNVVDACHAEALTHNIAFDEGCDLVRADEVQQGDVIREVDDRNVTVDMVRRVSNAVEMHIKGLWRIAYPHTIIKRVRPLQPVSKRP